MKIDAISNSYQYNPNLATKNTTFTSIHKAEYFMKVGESSYQKVSSVDLLKTLQRKLVMFLNKDYNDWVRKKAGKKVVTQKPEEALLKDRLVRFFYYRDNDYKNLRKASSYMPPTYGLYASDSYLFTGKSVDFLKDQSSGIKNVNSQIKNFASDISDVFSLSYDDAHRRAEQELSHDLTAAKTNYHTNVKAYIEKVTKSDPATNKPFRAYFEEVTNKKGKVTGYRLVDAEFSELQF